MFQLHSTTFIGKLDGYRLTWRDKLLNKKAGYETIVLLLLKYRFDQCVCMYLYLY